MATTESMRCRYVVKDGGDPFITAEPFDRKPDHERPLPGPDHLWFPEKAGTSLEKAQEIAEFLNENLADVAITRFGDAEDLARDVRLSERVQRIDTERFGNVISRLTERLAAKDIAGAAKALKGVEFVAKDVNQGWLKALALSRVILQKFGKNGSHDAA